MSVVMLIDSAPRIHSSCSCQGSIFLFLLPTVMIKKAVQFLQVLSGKPSIVRHNTTFHIILVHFKPVDSPSETNSGCTAAESSKPCYIADLIISMQRSDNISILLTMLTASRMLNWVFQNSLNVSPSLRDIVSNHLWKTLL